MFGQILFFRSNLLENGCLIRHRSQREVLRVRAPISNNLARLSHQKSLLSQKVLRFIPLLLPPSAGREIGRAHFSPVDSDESAAAADDDDAGAQKGPKLASSLFTLCDLNRPPFLAVAQLKSPRGQIMYG